MNLRLGVLVWAAVLTVAACGDDDASKDGTPSGSMSSLDGCGVIVDVSGEVDESITMDINDGCGGGGSGTDVSVGFGLTGDYNVRIALSDATRGMPEDGVAAVVTITRNADDVVWVTPNGACSVDLTTNVLAGETGAGTSFDLVGSGTCDAAMPATREDGGEGALSVGEFRFESSALWNE